MPELPEVETIVRRLKDLVVGKSFSQITVHADKSFGGDTNQITAVPIIDVCRRAKVIDISFQNNQHLLTHLKMTGQLIYVDGETRVGGGHPTADWVRDLPSKHTRIEYTFEDQSQLFFNDQRLFGWMRVFPSSEVVALFESWGPDINTPLANVETLYPLFQRRSVPVKQVLMDTKVVSGVGNIYACDALNLARISPFRPARSLSKMELETLLAAAKKVIDLGIEYGGTTFDGKYVGLDGFAGGYQERVLTYDRQGEACYNCGAPILKKKLAGRGTYYCAVCQK